MTDTITALDTAKSAKEPQRGQTDPHAICDDDFIKDVQRLKALRSFMIQHAVAFKGVDGKSSNTLGRLNLLRHRSYGRYPTNEEWILLEQTTQALYENISEPLRRKFLYSQVPNWVPAVVLFLGGVALLSMLVAVYSALKSNAGSLANETHTLIVLGCFLFWVAALGAIGSIAFIGMNALAVQEDATFDLTNARLITLRITLGALFGLVLTLPYGFDGFVVFVRELAVAKNSNEPSALAIQSIMLILPFVLGFSTSLVIMILNQFVEAV